MDQAPAWGFIGFPHPGTLRERTLSRTKTGLVRPNGQEFRDRAGSFCWGDYGLLGCRVHWRPFLTLRWPQPSFAVWLAGAAASLQQTGGRETGNVTKEVQLSLGHGGCWRTTHTPCVNPWAAHPVADCYILSVWRYLRSFLTAAIRAAEEMLYLKSERVCIVTGFL